MRTCSIEECSKKHWANGYCTKHNQRFKKYGNPLEPSHSRVAAKCSIEGCDNVSDARGWCTTHYMRWSVHGDPEAPRLTALPGTGYINAKGYHQFKRNGVVILEHREVMEKAIGRPLLSHENVHHKNLDRADNRIENLELWITSQPSGARVEDMVPYWKEMLALYDHGA